MASFDGRYALRNILSRSRLCLLVCAGIQAVPAWSADDYRFLQNSPYVEHDGRRVMVSTIHVSEGVSYQFRPKGTYVCNGVEKSKSFDITDPIVTVVNPPDDSPDRGTIELVELNPETPYCLLHIVYEQGKVDYYPVDLRFQIAWTEYWLEKVDGRWVRLSAEKSADFLLSQELGKPLAVFQVGCMRYGGDEGKHTAWESDDTNHWLDRLSQSEETIVSTPAWMQWCHGGREELFTPALPAANCLGWWALAGGPNWDPHSLAAEHFRGHVEIAGELSGDNVQGADQGSVWGQVEGESALPQIVIPTLKIFMYAGGKLAPAGTLVLALCNVALTKTGISVLDRIEEEIANAHSFLHGRVIESIELTGTDGMAIDAETRSTSYTGGEEKVPPDRQPSRLHSFGMAKTFVGRYDRPGQEGALGRYAAQGVLWYKVLNTPVRGRTKIPALVIRQRLTGLRWEKPAPPAAGGAIP